MKNNFSRSNVNESMLEVSMPDQSAFPWSHRVHLTPKMGEILPFNWENLIPNGTINGVNKPTLSLEKILTPSIGRVRMDTHNFVVLQNRINRDWKFFVEGKSGFSQKPNFEPFRLMSEILLFLLDPNSQYIDLNTSIADLCVPTYDNNHNQDGLSVTPVETALYQSDLTDYSNLRSLFTDCVLSACETYYQLINTDNHFLGFNKDFFIQEYNRLHIYASQLANMDLNSLPNLAQIFLEILRPYFGAGSIMEMLGYPKFEQYDRSFEQLFAVCSHYGNGGSGSIYYSYVITIPGITFANLFLINSFDFDNDAFGFVPSLPKDESPIRAYYSVWFDYFRNFHVEKRENILDPDTFDSISLIRSHGYLSNYASLADKQNHFNAVVSLIIPRRRNYARDYVTTVQVDDAYRYVYTPWLNSADGQAITDLDTDNFYNNIRKLLIDGQYFDFPAADMNAGTPSSSMTLMADLQTMRRSKMLERVLAREYYYPDTYAGRMLAHYGIKPGDIDSMNSVYLKGSEQFISGDQQIANVGTDLTPQGTRTMVAGVESVDPYNYHATDHAIFISTISLVPMVSYDSANGHLDEINLNHIPLPQFASDTRCLVRARDLIRGFDGDVTPFGYVPRYYAYRIHADEVHGRYLTDYRSYNFMRDWFNMTSRSVELSSPSVSQNPVYSLTRKSISLNPYFLRVNVPLDAFLGLQPWDSVAFGDVDIECEVVQPLPAAIEFI